MQKLDLKKFNLPEQSGVYFFKQGKTILYIGKASSLRDRVRSYFNPDLGLTRGVGIVQMIELADNLSFIETDSVLEALILEASEIKKHQPKYNTREKDDRSFNFVVITKEIFPRVLLVRGKELQENEDLAGKIKYQFGPFPHGGELKEALKIIRRLFPYRDKCMPQATLKPCFNAQIGLCPGVCSGIISTKEYGLIIKNIKHLFEGKKTTIIKDLTKQMKAVALVLNFEKAEEIKRKIFALNHIQDIALIKYRHKEKEAKMFRIEAFDVSHLSGHSTVGVMTVVLDGEIDKGAYRKFTIKGLGKKKVQIDDIANLKEILTRRFTHTEWIIPQLVVVDGGQAQLKAGQSVLLFLGLDIPVVGVVKDKHHRPREIIGNYKKIIENRKREIILANSEAHRFAIHFHRQIYKQVV